MKLSIQTKLISIIILILSLSILVISGVGYRFFAHSEEHALHSKALMAAKMYYSKIDYLVELGVILHPAKQFNLDSRELVESIPEVDYVAVTDTKNKIIYHNQASVVRQLLPGFTAQMHVHDDHQDVLVSEGVIEWQGKNYLESRLPLLSFDHRNIGWIRVGIPLSTLEQRLLSYRNVLFNIGFFALLFAAIVAFFIIRHAITRPIDDLRQSMKSVTKNANDLDHYVNNTTKDEIGSMARCFNQMIDALKYNKTQLAHYTNELEKKVAQRTEELEQLNQRLADDVKKKSIEQVKLKHMVHHDHLTGLPNRKYVMNALALMLEEARYHDAQLAVLFIDVDRFKSINDTYGHHIGDAFLKEFAQRLQISTKQESIVSRLAGDEFLIVVPMVTSLTALRQFTQSMIDTVTQPMTLENLELQPAMSVGVALYPSGASDLESLLVNADKAMYKAKQSGKNTFRLWGSKVAS
ncbi:MULTISPECIES: diguanylate cyclase domain-containing protein [unclassified Vibrio]|uniref:Diguanylate cyclase n=1 Tax=Vibrio sp. HB236076 TaxID=3232307 RepID=A0AB39HFW1_9VIBR|nr:diguanylate cyclase [Vibrio sp. HB161653]MDP5253231.1 diguanylate cyclase [Vibrio sp. HB161653]